MRYNGDLVRFEDARPLLYESAMNADIPVPPPTQDPAPASYNPFEEFAQNDFEQNVE